ncbi:MAG: hypothetical protein IAC68_03350 [Bacteroidetes bacterium]|uniref:Bacterial membrane protein YfhO n=1 Tax=Candidatus Egerieousia excrementavium TaxID=2840778 RepID=A0A9D9DLP2_9BACT|nr:hypothetical protein [Candidatus Egerieousia excrementavium]
MGSFGFKKILPYAGAILLFVIIAYAYAPQVLQGKIVNQSDISGWTGMSHEIVTHNENNPDDRTLWTNSMFGGMPATVISVVYKGDLTQYLYDILFIGERPASYLLISMIGGFLLCLAFGANIWLAILGAIAITFCSYNMQIIQVGHNSKMVAIAFMPWVLAAVVYAYRKSMLWGALFFAFALSFQIKANHPQITYYLAMIVAGFVIWQLCAAIKEKLLPRFIKVSALLLVAGALGIATNINHLWPTYEYSHYSMRGGSELAAKEGEEKSGGLDLEYATAWSYGVEETMNLMIPNFNGGASVGELGPDSETYKTLQQNGYAADQVVKALPLYWGPQSFTAGPMYMGAITIFLAILGLFTVRGGSKWWIAAVSLIALMLSWGYHFMPATKLFFNIAPLYNKFRTVSMILVVLQILLPLLAVISLKNIFCDNGSRSETGRKKIKRAIIWSMGITCGISFLFLLIPSLAGNFVSASDSQLPQMIAGSLVEDRISLLRNDALRSILFIAVATLVIWLGHTGKLKGNQAIIIVTFLILVDLWSVDRRYLNGSHFVTRREFNTTFVQRPVDKTILQDKAPDYRVLDLTTDPFNDATPSYYHKTVGGYSPAKLQRYQDIIENCLYQEIEMLSRRLESVQTMEQAQMAMDSYYPVLSMLNTKYIIINGSLPPLVNRHALGNAWFADTLVTAQGARMEMELLKGADPAREAVIEQRFMTQEFMGSCLAHNNIRPDSSSTISLVSYAPNRLVYEYSSNRDALAIFSEIYYPEGWKAVLKESNGKESELPIFRADYILRGLCLPAGSGEITFTFNPDSFVKGERCSMASSALLYVALLALLGTTFYNKLRRKDGKQSM